MMIRGGQGDSTVSYLKHGLDFRGCIQIIIVIIIKWTLNNISVDYPSKGFT